MEKNELTKTQSHFEITPYDALRQLHELQAVIKEVMKENEHYGIIPGVSKYSLYKSGAELLNNMYGYRLGDITILEKVEQWDVPVTEHSFPLFHYTVMIKLLDKNGMVISTGVGEANSFETKYRLRKVEVCPFCGSVDTIIKSKEEYGGGFLCYKAKGGCGTKIKSISTKYVHNERIYDQVNTLIKMAKKRAYIDATLSATRTSNVFTQDVEDMMGLQDIADADYVIDTEEQPVQQPIQRTTPHEQQMKQTTSQKTTATPAPEETPKQKPTSKFKQVQEEEKTPYENVVQAGVKDTEIYPGDYIIPFGIHKNKKINELSDEQLKKTIEWCERNDKFPDFVAVAKDYLKNGDLPF